jgi:capsule polysaccharide export protein KpsE/RkpR
MKYNASIGESMTVAICESQRNEMATIDRSLEKMKALYRDDQQTKLLTLRAETESLLQQLQEIKQQRLVTEELSH